MPTGFRVGGAYVTLEADLTKFDRDITRAEQRLAALQKSTSVPVPSSTGGGGAPRAAGDQQAADAALRLASARANLARAEGDESRALQILNSALAQNSGATETASLRVQTAAARLQNGTTFAKEFGSNIVGSLTSIVGPAALATAALGAVSKGVEAGKSALELDKAQNTLRAVAGSAEAYAQALDIARQQQRLFGGTLQENIEGLTGLQITARQSGADLKQLIDLSQRLGTLDPSQGVAGARIALSEALSGDPTSLAKRYEIPKAALAQLRDESTSASEKLAIIDQYLNKVGITSATTAGAISQNAQAFNRLGAAADTAKTTIGSELVAATAPAASSLANLLQAFDGTRESLISAAGAAPGFLAMLQGFGPPTEAATAAQREWAASLFQGFDVLTQYLGLGQQATAVETQHAAAILQSADAEDRRTAATMGSIIAQQEAAAAEIAKTQAEEASTAQSQLLEAQIRLVGDAYLALNPNIDAAGVASAVAAGKIDAAVGTYINMTLATAKARAELAALQAQAGLAGGAVEGRAERDRPGDRAQAAAAGAAAQRERAAALAAARSAQVLATGTTAAKRAELQKQYNDAVAAHGRESAEAVNAQTKLLQAEQQGAGGRRAGRASAGRTQISDQQRLNNQLLADQERANDRAAQAERDHARNLLRIERDYQQKSLAQQKKNEIDKRQSELSFLEKLTGSSLNKGDAQSKTALQQINQDYYAAYDKAQQIAQAGNAQLADEYLKLKQEQYEAEIQYQEQLEEARKNKDAGEIARLQALEAKRQAIYAEQEKQLLEGGDAIQNDRAQAIQDENTRYAEAQGKIGDSADAAAERKIAAAVRSGKAIDAETAALQKQADQYERMGRATAAPATTPTSAGQPTDAQQAVFTAVADAAVLGAIQSQTAMQIDKFDTMIGRLDNVERAVRSLRSAGGVAA